MNAEPVLEPVQNIADNRACRACDNANGCWHFWNFLFAVLIKQAFTRQHPAAIFKLFQQCTFTSNFDLANNDLIFRLTGKGGQTTRGDHLKPFFRLDRKIGCHGFPAHSRKGGSIIFQGKIKMAGRGFIGARNFGANPHKLKSRLNRCLYGA